MFVVNYESLDKQRLFYCKSLNLMRFLTEIKGLNFISRKPLDGEINRYVWLFTKSKLLDEYLAEWKLNKERGEYVFKRNEVKNSE